MCEEAIRLMNEVDGSSIPCDVEKQIILLLNKAETYSDMSAYQLAIARKQLAEIYYASGITGSALEQFCMAQSLNPKIAVKKKLKELQSIPRKDLIYSLDGNMVDEPDYGNLTCYNNDLPDKYNAEHYEHELKMAKLLHISLEEYREYRENIYKKLQEEALEEDAIYDQEFEDMIYQRISKLGKQSIDDFYLLRHKKADGIVSAKKQDIMLLESMEDSYKFEELHRSAVASVNLEALKNIEYDSSITLSNEEIRLFSKVINKKVLSNIPAYFTHTYNMDYQKAFFRFIASGFMEFASMNYRVEKLTINELKNLLSEKGIVCNGKKNNYVQLVLDNFSIEELNRIPEYFVATETGNKLLSDNQQLLDDYNSGILK